MLRLSFPSVSMKMFPFLMYGMMLFFIVTADGVMSYLVPVVIDKHLGSTTLMGIILATSSMFGMFFDFFFSKAFPNKKSFFFNRILVGTSILFPLSFFLFDSVPTYIFSMFVWGLYYEAMVFSNFHAVHEYVKPAQHLMAWGMLVMIKDIAWVIGPFLAATLDGDNPIKPFYVALVGYGIGIFIFILRMLMTRNRVKEEVKEEQVAHTMKEEFGIWRTYGKAIWPLLFLMFLFFLIDSTFFSIGPVFSELLHEKHPLGNLFVTMYTIPTAIFILASGILAKRLGKKRSAFMSGLFAGVGLMIMSRADSVMAVLISTFIASMGLGILYPELTAVFEDYVARAKKYGNDIVGLTAITGSVGYVVGPIINGVLAEKIGTQNVFGLWGLILAIFSLFAFFVVKRKVRLPQKEVELAVETLRKGE